MFSINFFQNELKQALRDNHVSEKLIDEVIESGYWLLDNNGHRYVSDFMYGNKVHSSHFDLHNFIRYIKNEFEFDKAPPFKTYEVRNIEEIQEILLEPRREFYIKNELLSYRGQPREYTFQRKVPNPFRSDSTGQEVSILPGLYRQSGRFYDFNHPIKEQRSLAQYIPELEPNDSDDQYSGSHLHDFMRIEQHYATQTAGLDIAFELDTGLFFATHKFSIDGIGLAKYEEVKRGEHTGLIYCFKFTQPSVKKSEFLIKGFDFFKTYTPERILRQDCGLPLIGDFERNITITDIDCIIKLHPDFILNSEAKKTAEYMFPNIQQDKFYQRLLSIKDSNPGSLQTVVEYKWARV